MVRVTVNDKTVEVPPGTSVMDAIFHAGYDVPLFCAEKYLSPVGACRMCLVRTGAPRKGPDGQFILENGAPKIFWMPKLQAACITAVSEGMVIDTLSDEVRHAQSGMVELTLFNHPLDCPTCDKGGACELQDRSYEYGLAEKFYHPNRLELPLYTRFEMTRRHVDKHHSLSPFIVLDRERCIHCKRCVRYFEEVPGEEVLDFIERGVHTFISSEEVGLPSGYSGNIVDICPVGALLDQTARFRARNWEYDTTETTSMDDASGAGILVDARSGRLERIRAAERREVNEIWISDAARFGHQWVNENRLLTPLVRRGGRLEEATWEEALAAIRAGLEGVPREEVGLYLGRESTLEEGLAAVELAHLLGTPHRDFQGRTLYPATAFAPASFEELLEAEFVLVLGDPAEEAAAVHLRLSEYSRGLKPAPRLNHGTPFADLNIKERMPRLTHKLALFSPYPSATAKWAYAWGVHAPGEEQALLAALLGQGEAPQGLAGAVAWVREQLATKKSLLVLGAHVLNHPAAAQMARTLAEQRGMKVLAMTPAPNARGLEALGLYPASGGAAWTEPGPKVAYYGYLPTEAQLRSARFRILHLSHRHPLAERYADVVLPSPTFYEKRGHTVNLEGRVLPLEPAAIQNGQADGAVAALALLAEALGVRTPVRLVRQATRLLQEKHRLPPAMERWLPKAAGWAARGEAAGGALFLRPTLWRREQLLGAVAQAVEVRLEVGPATARAQGLAEGYRVELELPWGPEAYEVRVVEGLPEGVLYLPALGPWAGRRLEARVLVGGGV
ncbi:NADH-quinone oxidoreductase [Meiothermus sp. QL-1]|uniref:molybdopterin-dependent oxidoreductase n=1 Tax=Meiothermus sp. QL-1 TaxID=2058095 RepID=UPI000E0C9120|nr:molybdopterin-dependent oxidoreductase [Meiothermus sp. QL-1]RDI94697.1 NADH-quinone oxidoreductase [Meiothermus sp. QL-1]